jgi:hypothetical protein
MDEQGYEPPKIVYEGELEVTAGSPLIPGDLDPLGLGEDGG